jgi:adenylate cyclase
MVAVILDNGGTVDKLAGEGILAHFGVPLPSRKDAWRAVRCAMQMQARLEELNQRGEFLQRHPLKVGIGLSTGKVVAGIVGSEQRMEYTAIGDVVQFAPRVEALTRIYRCPLLLCDETARQIGSDLLLREVDRVRIKGRNHPTHIYDVIAQPEEASPGAIRLMLEYRSAFAPYAAGHFLEAARQFDALSRMFPSDGPSATLAERCRRFVSDPPRDWTCVYEPDAG